MDGIDSIDMKILRVLQENASHSAAKIADLVGLSQSPCWRRIQRLKDEGYISKVVAVLNRHKLNLNTLLFVHVKVIRNDQESLAQFTTAIRGFNEVLDCYAILGVYDFLLRVLVSDMQAYEKFFFTKLSTVPNIREVHSFVAVSEIKSTTALPLAVVRGDVVANGHGKVGAVLPAGPPPMNGGAALDLADGAGLRGGSRLIAIGDLP
jgi:Lrp/AsnC family transcriptional regulator